MYFPDPYLTLKCLHILGVISWMAGLLYYFRLLIYHFEYGKSNGEIHQLLSLMERRLLRYITLPAMVVSIVAGLGMIHIHPTLIQERWFQAKAFCGLLMAVVTFACITLLNKFKNKDWNGYSSKMLRISNEIPTLLMVIIVILVIFRPNF